MKKGSIKGETKLPLIEAFEEAAQFNKEVRRWTYDTQSLLVRSVKSLTGKKRHFFFKKLRGYKVALKAEKIASAHLADTIKPGTKKNGFMGQIDRISFSFPRHGVFIHHGVSRKHPAAGPRRKKIDWFNPIITEREKELADLAAKFYANALVKSSLRIR